MGRKLHVSTEEAVRLLKLAETYAEDGAPESAHALAWRATKMLKLLAERRKTILASLGITYEG